MNFTPTPEQEMFRDAVRRFARENLAPGALARAHRPDFPFDAAKLAAEFGLLGITIAEKDGGQGGTLMDAIIAIEEVALADPRGADAIQQGSFGAIRTFAEYASPAQKERHLPSMLRGETVIGLGMTEAGAGSAVTDLETRLIPDGDGYRLQGSKVFTSHSVEADVFLIYCRFGPGVGNIGSVILERGAEGFGFGKPSSYMNTERWCPLFFDNVRIEKSRSQGSTPSASAMPPVPVPLASSLSTRRVTTRWSARSSAARSASFKGCNGSSPTCRWRWNPPVCCFTAPRCKAISACPPRRIRRSPS